MLGVSGPWVTWWSGYKVGRGCYNSWAVFLFIEETFGGLFTSGAFVSFYSGQVFMIYHLHSWKLQWLTLLRAKDNLIKRTVRLVIPEKSCHFLPAAKCPEGCPSLKGPTDDRLFILINQVFSFPSAYPENFCTASFYCQFSHSMCLRQLFILGHFSNACPGLVADYYSSVLV